MKKSNAKKLSLSRETLVRLNAPDLILVGGGAWSDDSVCPTTGPSNFCPQKKQGNPND